MNDATKDCTADRCRTFLEQFRHAVARDLVLPPALIEQAAIALLTRGHLLLEGPVGTGKRSLAQASAQAAGLGFSAFTCSRDLTADELAGSDRMCPDPADSRNLALPPCPLNANVVYAEGLDLLPPRSLAFVMDAVWHRKIGYGPGAGDLPEPFLAVASTSGRNENAVGGLTAAALDRFLLNSVVDYPSGSEEWEIARRGQVVSDIRIEPIVTSEELAEMQDAVSAATVPDDVLGYAWALVRATRPGNELAPDFVESWIGLGVSPKGLVALMAAVRARALLHGRREPTRRDVYHLVRPAMRHRILGNEEAKAAGLTVDRLIGMLLERVSIDGDYARPNPD